MKSNVSRLKTNSTAAASAPGETSNNDSQKKPRKPSKARGLAKVLFQNPEHHTFLAYLHTRHYELIPIFTGESFGNVPIVDIGVGIKDEFQFELDDLMYDGMFSMRPPVCEHDGHEDEAVQGLGDIARAAALEALRECEQELATFEIVMESVKEIFDAKNAVIAAIQHHPNVGGELSKAFVVRHIRLVPLAPAQEAATQVSRESQ